MPYYNIPLPPVQEGRGILWLLFQLLQKLGQRVHIDSVYPVSAADDFLLTPEIPLADFVADGRKQQYRLQHPSDRLRRLAKTEIVCGEWPGRLLFRLFSILCAQAGLSQKIMPVIREYKRIPVIG